MGGTYIDTRGTLCPCATISLLVRIVPMITKPDTFRTLIDRIGGVPAFAAATGIGEFAAKKMRDRNSVAVGHWPAVIQAARGVGLILTTDDLVNMKLRAKAPEMAREAS